jgi:hypothetical protein
MNERKHERTVSHQIQFREVPRYGRHVDVFDVRRSARQRRRQSVRFIRLGTQVVQRGSDVPQQQIEILGIAGRTAVIGISRILPIDVDPVEVVFDYQIPAISCEIQTTRLVGGHRGEVTAAECWG